MIMPSYDNKVLTGDQLVYYSGLVKTALAGKQDSLVFNTAYNASTNKVATMSDITSAISGISISSTNVATNYTDSETGNARPLDDVLEDIYGYISDVDNSIAGMMIDWGNVVVAEEIDENTGDINRTFLDTYLTGVGTSISGKQDALVFNTAYNASSNKVATMSDITTALGGISSFSFEIVQSLPQSNISTSKIYLVAKQTSGTNQVYTEYAYVNNAWEIIGDTQMTIDTLSNAEVSTIWSTATATV